MKMIHPNEIGSKISTLLYNAGEFAYCVTPFVRIREWKKIITNLQRARDKGVDIRFFTKKLDMEDLQLLQKLAIPVYSVANLHTKLYISEAEAIVSSMNLIEFCDNHSVDIALHFTATDFEYDQLINYYRAYIQQGANDKQLYTSAFYPRPHLEQLHQELKRLYPTDCINRSSKYVYFNRVAPAIDAFIEEEAICLKSTLSKKVPESIGHSCRLVAKALQPLQLQLIARHDRYWQIPMHHNTALKSKLVLDTVRYIFA